MGLRREHGVASFVAHSMTVTERNVDQIAGVIHANGDAAFGMSSFQPAAFVGDDRRSHDGYGATSGDAAWAQIEPGRRPLPITPGTRR